MNSARSIEQAENRVRRRFGHTLHAIELAGLVVLGVATAFAMARETWKMAVAGDVSLTDLLLMFLYLEVLEMNLRYLRQGRLPVRFPLYIAMASLARDLILRGATDTQRETLTTTAGIVLLAVGVVILRFGQYGLPRTGEDDEGAGSAPAPFPRSGSLLNFSAAPPRKGGVMDPQQQTQQEFDFYINLAKPTLGLYVRKGMGLPDLVDTKDWQFSGHVWQSELDAATLRNLDANGHAFQELGA